VNLGIKNLRVLVTAGAGGIGLEIARAFTAEGARVHVCDVDAKALRALAKSDPKLTQSKADVSDRTQVAKLFKEALAALKGLDVLVNNAGIVRDSQLVKWKDGTVSSLMDDATFDAVIAVNLKGVFLCTRAVVPHMIANGGGSILNASSIVGLYGNFGQTNYAATKAGVISFTQTWARELGKYGIRVNAVAPGFIATEMVKAMPQKVLDSMAARTPLQTLGEPSDIANAYVWLASKAAKFVHGTVLSVDGGLVLGT